jgi:hypothetical protein|tara:strand:- start:34106 stop:35257 length:1152 start_codon:yes stop_codon:yes gene_type:complete
MPADFSAKQIRVSQLMASGGIAGTTAGLIVYSASNATDLVGGFPASLLTDVGSDVYIFVSGTRDGKDLKRGVSLFGGDVVVSGTLYAEKSVIEVNATTTGSLTISGSLFVSRSAEIRQGLVVNAAQGNLAIDDTRIVSANKSHALFVDASTDQVLILSGGGVGSYDEAKGSDVNFYVSGTVGSAGTGVSGASLFGGDTVLSGNLHFLKSATGSFGLALQSDGPAGELQIGEGLDLRILIDSDDAIIENITSDKDIIFKVSDDNLSTEVARFVGADAALKIATNKKIMFSDSGEYISGDGTNLTVGSGGDIVLAPGGSDVLPDIDNTRNLGSPAKRWANIYTGDLHLKNDRGDWTIIEESDYLSVRNNSTGKIYKMMLSPINED